MDSIPAASDLSEFSRPKHGPAASAKRCPLGAAQTHPKDILLSLPDPSDTKINFPCLLESSISSSKGTRKLTDPRSVRTQLGWLFRKLSQVSNGKIPRDFGSCLAEVRWQKS